MFRRFLALVMLVSSLSLAAPLEADWDAALSAYDEGDYELAIPELRALADEGHREAQFMLGQIYDLALGVPQDHAEAVRWYRLAAERGLASARHVLGLMYEIGQGLDKNSAQAAKWYGLAADQDYVYSQVNLAFMFRDGRGTALDKVMAYVWFDRAASQGHSTSAGNRDELAKRMTTEEIEQAQRLRWEQRSGPAD